jgi:putative Mg2+ transporter-C (MgtC) family protein
MDLHLEVLGRLLMATALGGAIGFERELTGKAAGLRTHILICLGAALFTVMSMELPSPATATLPRGDTSRIAANIVTGVGFLGAGAILHAHGQIRGLTTAATIWVVSAIGMAAGAGEYVIAVGTATLVLLVLWPLRWWERNHGPDNRQPPAAAVD